MSLSAGSRSHIEDADLVRYMDHQLDREGLRKARSHLGVCPECAARLVEMERDSATVSRFLNDLAIAAPDAGRKALALAAVERARIRRSATGPISGGMLLRVAAAFLIGLTAVIATEPGRAWMADQVERVAGDNPGPLAARVLDWLGREPALAAKEEAAPAAGSGGMVRSEPSLAAPVPRADAEPSPPPPVRFTPRGQDVVLVFDHQQALGTATLLFSDVPEASVQAVGERGNERFVPTESGLRVQNQEASRADYMLTIPVRYRYVRVRVGDRPEALIVIDKSKRDWMWTVPMQRSVAQ